MKACPGCGYFEGHAVYCKTGAAPNNDRRIVCAANRNRKTALIICGARHFDWVMASQMEARPHNERDDWRESEQGFIDQYGNFLTREKAHAIATDQGQIIRRVEGDEGCLYSENLY